jgi:hypothetical protein
MQKYENVFEIKTENKEEEKLKEKFIEDAITSFSRNLINRVINGEQLKIYNIKYEVSKREVLIDENDKVIGLANIDIEVGDKKLKDTDNKKKLEVLSVQADITILEKRIKDKGTYKVERAGFVKPENKKRN